MSAESFPSLQRQKPQRVLACVNCRQRKIKCDRKFPCADCIKARVQCVPATLARRQQRRRFPERELLQRLGHYEGLLNENNIKFEPLGKDSSCQKASPPADDGDDSDEEQPRLALERSPTSSTTIKSEGGFEVKNLWHAMSHGFRDPDNESDSSNDDVRESTIKQAWDQSAGFDDNLLFGSHKTNIDLLTLHPDPVQIFRLWQIYLDHVNPLLKVTHTSSLQARIIEAAGNLTSIDPPLEALMFSIYSMSILSLDADECPTMFGSSKEDVLTGYQFGCQQALLNCSFLRSSSRDCLTALYLYLVSIRSNTMPPSLSSLLGVAIRIAQRMRIHSEPSLAKLNILEAEMCRRLWWSLVLFDARVGEMANTKPLTLDPTWDCKIPLNVNDSDLRPEMKDPPTESEKPTDALFAILNCELGDFLRHNSFYLDFSNPALKPLTRNPNGGPTQLPELENLIETRYLDSCDPANPFHFTTIWATRKMLAKFHLVEHLSRFSGSSARRTAGQHDVATSHALRMLECDTKIMTSPLTKPYQWHNTYHYPFPAYLQTLQDLRRRPNMPQASKAWDVLSNNWAAWSGNQFRDKGPFFQLFANVVLQAWAASEAKFQNSGQPLHTPEIIASIRYMKASMTPATSSSTGTSDQPSIFSETAIDDLLAPMSMDFGDQDFSYGINMQDPYAGTGSEMFSGMPGQEDPFEAQVNQLDWTALGKLH